MDSFAMRGIVATAFLLTVAMFQGTLGSADCGSADCPQMEDNASSKTNSLLQMQKRSDLHEVITDDAEEFQSLDITKALLLRLGLKIQTSLSDQKVMPMQVRAVEDLGGSERLAYYESTYGKCWKFCSKKIKKFPSKKLKRSYCKKQARNCGGCRECLPGKVSPTPVPPTPEVEDAVGFCGCPENQAGYCEWWCPENGGDTPKACSTGRSAQYCKWHDEDFACHSPDECKQGVYGTDTGVIAGDDIACAGERIAASMAGIPFDKDCGYGGPLELKADHAWSYVGNGKCACIYPSLSKNSNKNDAKEAQSCNDVCVANDMECDKSAIGNFGPGPLKKRIAKDAAKQFVELGSTGGSVEDVQIGVGIEANKPSTLSFGGYNMMIYETSTCDAVPKGSLEWRLCPCKSKDMVQ